MGSVGSTAAGSASSQIDFSRFQGHGNTAVNEQAQQVARKMASEGGLLGLALCGKGGGGLESLMAGGSLSASVMGMGSSASNSASVMGLVSALTSTGGSMEKDLDARKDEDDRKEDKKKDRGDKKEREPKEVSLSPVRASELARSLNSRNFKHRAVKLKQGKKKGSSDKDERPLATH